MMEKSLAWGPKISQQAEWGGEEEEVMGVVGKGPSVTDLMKIVWGKQAMLAAEPFRCEEWHRHFGVQFATSERCC